MNRKRLYRVYFAAGLITLAFLIWLTIATPPDPAVWLPTFLFCVLIAFTDTFGVRFAEGTASLLPMATVAAYLVVGSVPAGWAAFVGALAYGTIRTHWAERLQLPRMTDRAQSITVTAANATMHTASVLAGGAVFQALGGTTPLVTAEPRHILPLVLLGLTFLAANYLIVVPVIAARGRTALGLYLRSLPNLLFYEGGPLVFAPLVALIYTRLGLAQFILFALLLVISSLITRGLALTSRRLERRVKELDSLQAVGQALSASLDLDTILSAVYTQVAALMPAHNFYVALYDPEADEVSFPLAIEDDKPVPWRSRRAGNGLTEHVLHTRAPLLIQRDVATALARLGLAQIGQPTASWLGVPILAGDNPLGAIAIQSYAALDAYDASHQEILMTIAAQAAVAIQNARLYAQTDAALARRVQELNSILRTTREGILLLDSGWGVLAANRALADFLGVAQTELAGQTLDTPRADGEPLITLIGYAPEDLETACQNLAQGEEPQKQIIVVPGPPERHVERALAPVHDRQGTITGWLLIFRDLTEEIRLARLREDLTHMLVHDLRSPLTALKGSLDLLETTVGEGKPETDTLLGIAQRGSDRMLRMINELLDIGKLESGQLPVRPEAVNVESLLNDVAVRLAPLATTAQITISISAAPDLPLLYVDPEFIGRVLHNLLDNAIKFTPDGGNVRLWARRDPETTTAMLVGVNDTGPGIPPEEQQRLFEKFQQIASISGRRTGTGLGLPFCKLAIEAHGGQIWVESEVGKGSTFVIRLPVMQ